MPLLCLQECRTEAASTFFLMSAVSFFERTIGRHTEPRAVRRTAACDHPIAVLDARAERRGQRRR